LFLFQQHCCVHTVWWYIPGTVVCTVHTYMHTAAPVSTKRSQLQAKPANKPYWLRGSLLSIWLITTNVIKMASIACHQSSSSKNTIINHQQHWIDLHFYS
jgi:hypothetical protein